MATKVPPATKYRFTVQCHGRRWKWTVETLQRFGYSFATIGTRLVPLWEWVPIKGGHARSEYRADRAALRYIADIKANDLRLAREDRARTALAESKRIVSA